MKLETSYKKKRDKTSKFNNMPLSHQWVTEEIKGEIKKYLETYENKYIFLCTEKSKIYRIQQKRF